MRGRSAKARCLAGPFIHLFGRIRNKYNSHRSKRLVGGGTSQPNDFACARRSGIMSPTMTHAAPRRWQEAAHASPTGPAPATYTVDPGRTPAVYAPWKPARCKQPSQRLEQIPPDIHRKFAARPLTKNAYLCVPNATSAFRNEKTCAYARTNAHLLGKYPREA